MQFGYGKDILGYSEINVRYGGVFGEEAIAGSYIQKFSILGIFEISKFAFTFIEIPPEKTTLFV